MAYLHAAKPYISDSPVVLVRRERVRTPAGKKTLVHLRYCPHCLQKTPRGRDFLRYLKKHEVRPKGIVERLAQLVRFFRLMLDRFAP